MFEDFLNRLAVLAPGSIKAKMTVELSGLPINGIDFSGSAKEMWYNILLEARKHKDGVLKIINKLLNDYPEDSILLNEKKRLLSNESIPPPSGENNIGSNSTGSVIPTIDKDVLKELVANVKISKVLEKLSEIKDQFDKDQENEFIGFQSKYNKLKRDNRLGLMTQAEYDQGMSRLTHNLLEFIDLINT